MAYGSVVKLFIEDVKPFPDVLTVLLEANLSTELLMLYMVQCYQTQMTL